MRVFIWLSFIVSGMQAILILTNKNMKQTFGKILLLSILEAAYFNNLEQSTFACDLKLPELFATTVIWDFDGSMTWGQKKVLAITILDDSNRFFNLFFWSSSIIVNVMLMRDLL